MGNDAEIKLQLQIDDIKAQTSLTNITKQADTLDEKLSKLSKGFENAGKKLTIGLTAPITGFLGVGIKYNAEMEQYQSSLSTLLGDTEKAVKMMEQLKQMATKTPFETSDLIKASETMLAFGLDSNKVTKYLQMLGDASLGNADKFSGLTLAFSQVQSTGRLMGQDLLQMINQGFNPLQIISEKTGKSMAELKKDMEKGAISADMVTQAFEIATSEGGRFFNAMDKQSQTTSGRLSTLKDSFNASAGALTESLLPIIEQFINKLTSLFDWVSKLDKGQQEMLLTILALTAGIGPFLLLIGKGIETFMLLKSAYTAITKAQWLWSASLWANPITWIVIAIMALIVAFGFLIFKVGSVKGAFLSLWESLKLIFSNVGVILKNAFKIVVNSISTIINLAISAINKLIGGILAPFNAIISGLNKLPGVNLPTLKLSIPKIPMLDSGTNYVQRDGLAFLHKGEAVVPSKYNPAIGGLGQMMQLLIQIPDIVMDGRSVAQTQMPYITKLVKIGGGAI